MEDNLLTTHEAGSDSDSDGASEPWELVEEEEEEEESNPDLDGVASVSSESDSPPVGHLHSRSPSPVRRSFSSAADEPPMVAADSDDEDFARQLVEQVLQRCVDAATVETETEAAAAAAAEREKPSTKAVLLRGAGLGELMSVVVSTLAAPLHVLTRPHAPAPAVAHAAQLVSDEAAAVAAAAEETAQTAQVVATVAATVARVAGGDPQPDPPGVETAPVDYNSTCGAPSATEQARAHTPAPTPTPTPSPRMMGAPCKLCGHVVAAAVAVGESATTTGEAGWMHGALKAVGLAGLLDTSLLWLDVPVRRVQSHADAAWGKLHGVLARTVETVVETRKGRARLHLVLGGLLGVSAYLTMRFASRLRAKEQEAASLLVEVVRLQEQLSAAAREYPAGRSLSSVLGHGARGLNNMTYATTLF